MNSPNPGFDKRQLHELASAVFDGRATERQLRELTEILRESPSARDEYLKLVDLHATLATDIATAHGVQQHVVAERVVLPRRIWLPFAAVAALAASLLIAVTWFGADDSDARPVSFATIAQATEAVWDSNQFAIGNRIGPATMQLKSGLVRLEFDSGVEVTLEGPAVFRLIDVAKTELKSGMLTATVPPGAEGFTVDTPSAQVIDLGTSFGIDLSNDGFSNVSVFDGEVEVAPLDSGEQDAVERLLLSEGEAVRIGAGYEIENIDFDPRPFEKMWPFASGITGSTETISFVPPWPRKIRSVKSDEQIFVRPEGHPVQLETELKVNISEPGDCAEIGDLSPTILQENETVRSYVLHFSPETQLVERRAKRVTGSITFDGPVLGMIVLHDELLASSRRFGRRRAGEAQHRRELNLTGDEAGDRITLSQDRKTVTLDLISPRRSSDLIRVIVESSSGFQRSARRKRN
ncbi:MAG: FecR domain-containing protein [Fuerstiella sp.]|nr:FecR domain-containing protein [Fuerstiella sp.]